MRFQALACGLLISLASLSTAAARVPSQTTTDKAAEQKPTKADALDAAHQLLGNYADIVRFGELNRPGLTEAVAVVKRGTATANAMHITDLAILQFRDGDWKVALSTDKYGAKNNSGYVGVEFLNDSITRASFRLKILDGGGHGRLRLMLTSDRGGVPVVIAWNPKVGRYEALDDHGAKFMPEVANPPTMKSEKK